MLIVEARGGLAVVDGVDLGKVAEARGASVRQPRKNQEASR
jgi:hypothetical protein